MHRTGGRTDRQTDTHRPTQTDTDTHTHIHTQTQAETQTQIQTRPSNAAFVFKPVLMKYCFLDTY